MGGMYDERAAWWDVAPFNRGWEVMDGEEEGEVEGEEGVDANDEEEEDEN